MTYLIYSMRARVHVAIMLLSAWMLTACDTVYLGGDMASARSVQFVAQLDNSLNVSYGAPSRAADLSNLASANITHFMVFDGSTLLVDQKSTDPGFGEPSFDLTYGVHELRFVAHDGSDGLVTNNQGVLSFRNICRSYYRSYPITVTPTTENQTVVLTRAFPELLFHVNDKIPENVDHFILTLNPVYTAFSVVDSAMTTPHSYNLNLPAGYRSTRIYPLALADYATTFTVTAYTSAGAEVAKHVIPITLRRNTQITVSGNFFHTTSAPAFAIQSLWADSVLYSF